MASYNYYYDLTPGVYQAAPPNSQLPHRGNMSLNVAAAPTWCQPTAQAGSSTTPLSMPSTSIQTPQGTDQSRVEAYLRVLNPANTTKKTIACLRYVICHVKWIAQTS